MTNEYHEKLIKLGKCVRCRKKRTKYARLCNACAVLQRDYARKYLGWKPWKKGGRGRPPLVKPKVA